MNTLHVLFQLGCWKSNSLPSIITLARLSLWPYMAGAVSARLNGWASKQNEIMLIVFYTLFYMQFCHPASTDADKAL